jgi:hypothetical protein
MGFVAVLLMLAGAYLATLFISFKTTPADRPSERRRMTYLTGFAAAIRGGIMPFFTYGLLYHILLPVVVGTNTPEAYIVALVPSFIAYNLTIVLYTVPIAHFAATKTSKATGIKTCLL